MSSVKIYEKDVFYNDKTYKIEVYSLISVYKGYIIFVNGEAVSKGSKDYQWTNEKNLHKVKVIIKNCINWFEGQKSSVEEFENWDGKL